MEKCKRHQCEIRTEDAGHGKTVDYCPKCRKEATDRIMSMFRPVISDKKAIEQMTFVTVQDMQERLEDAKYALEKIAQGHVFETADEAEKWARDIAENALEELV